MCAFGALAYTQACSINQRLLLGIHYYSVSCPSTPLSPASPLIVSFDSHSSSVRPVLPLPDHHRLRSSSWPPLLLQSQQPKAATVPRNIQTQVVWLTFTNLGFGPTSQRHRIDTRETSPEGLRRRRRRSRRAGLPRWIRAIAGVREMSARLAQSLPREQGPLGKKRGGGWWRSGDGSRERSMRRWADGGSRRRGVH